MAVDIPVNKGQRCTLTVTGLSHQGEGVGRYEGFAMFVPQAIPGDVVEVEVISTKKTYGRGLVHELLDPAADRVEPRCPVAHRCGGCQLQHMQYAAQLHWKQKLVEDAFSRIGGLDVQVLPVRGMEDPWHYRNKGQFPVGKDGGGVRLGFFAPRSHDIVTFEHCYVQPDAINAAVKVVEELSRRHQIEPYDERTHRGTLRHVVVRSAQGGRELMVVLVSRQPSWSNAQFFEDMKQSIPNLKVLAVNYNPERTNAVFGKKTTVLSGDSQLHEAIGDRWFRISPRSFFQTNSRQTRVLYDEVRQRMPNQDTSLIWDLHCGTGTIGIYAAGPESRVVGIEVIPEAVADARDNAAGNNVSAEFIVGKAEIEAKALAAAQGIPDAVILDPPRKGCDAELLTTLIELKVPRIVYVSCNPTTLARDAAIMAENGYKLGQIQPVDMFPHTAHVECVVVLWK